MKLLETKLRLIETYRNNFLKCSLSEDNDILDGFFSILSVTVLENKGYPYFVKRCLKGPDRA